MTIYEYITRELKLRRLAIRVPPEGRVVLPPPPPPAWWGDRGPRQ